jgi:chromate transporter
MLRIGATAFGGGSATIVAMRQLALRKRWLSEEEFLETVVLSRVTPGITILAQVILIGKRVDGLRGILAGIVGMLLPSITITILLARLYVLLKDKPWSARPLEMVAAIAAGFAVALVLLLLKDTLAVDRHWRGPLAFLAYVALGAAAPNPVLMLVAAVVAGVLFPALFVANEAPDAQTEDTDAA